MRSMKSASLASVIGLALFATAASADVYNKKTELTVNETIEVPGAVLPPGKYVVKLVDSQSNRHIVQFLNEKEDEVLSTVIAIPNSRMEPTGDTEFAWYETPAGEPPALRAWFYPGDSFGQEFAYPEDRATTLAQATSQQVPQMTEEEASIATRPEPQPSAEAETAEAAPAPQPQESPSVTTRENETIAQAAPPPEPQPQPQVQSQQEPQPDVTQQAQAQTETEPAMPETAGFGALLALIGLGSLGASAAVRKLRR